MIKIRKFNESKIKIADDSWEANDSTWLHSSPSPITKIDWLYNVFEGVLFFSTSPYSPGDINYVYAIEAPDTDILEVFKIEKLDTRKNKEADSLVKSYIRSLDLDENDEELYDEVVELLSESHEKYYKDFFEDYDVNDDWTFRSESIWRAQAYQAKIVRAFGYIGALGEDEQGTVLAVDLVGREHLLLDVTDYYL